MDIKERTSEILRTTPVAEKRMPDAQRIAFLVIGDIIVFLVFAAIGRRSHGESSGISALFEIAKTAAPFAIGWFAVAPFLGAFRRGLEVQPGKMALRVGLAWLVAWPVGMALRGILVDHHVPPWTFALITLISNTILLMIWRVPFSFVGHLRKR